jgi:4-amino-4-deoxy-L-arabinose transferase-like glycosyltransferase
MHSFSLGTGKQLEQEPGAPPATDLRRASHTPRDKSQANFIELAVRVAIALAIVTCIIARIFRLGSRELWLDETYSALLANLPFKQMLKYSMGDVHPPLFNVLLWSWVRLVGGSEAVLRLFSVVLFSAGMAGFFFLARKWLGARSAAFSTLLFALSPILFDYSLEVRMYMLLVCAVIGVLSVHRIVTSETNPSWLLYFLYSFAAALVYYTHYLGLFIVFALFIDWCISTRFHPDQLLRLGFAGFLTLALIAPWIPVMLHQHAQRLSEDRALTMSYEDPTSLTFHEAPPKPTLRKRLPTYVYTAGVAIGLYPRHSGIALIGLGLPIVLVLIGVLFLALTGDATCRLFLISGFFLLGGMFFLDLTQPRYFLPLLPLLFLAVARAIQVYEQSRWSLIARTIGVLILVIYSAGLVRQDTKVHPRSWSQLVASVSHNYRPNDVVVFDALYGQVVFDYYARQEGFHPNELGFPESVYHWWERQAYKGWAGPVVHKSDLETIAASIETPPEQRTVWLVLYELRYYDPEDALLERLSQNGNAVEAGAVGTQNSFPFEGLESPRLVAIRMKDSGK